MFVSVIKEMHLVNNLKVNFFIENNLLTFELIDILISINTVFIENDEIISSIVVKIKSFFQRKFTYATKKNDIYHCIQSMLFLFTKLSHLSAIAFLNLRKLQISSCIFI